LAQAIVAAPIPIIKDETRTLQWLGLTLTPGRVPAKPGAWWNSSAAFNPCSLHPSPIWKPPACARFRLSRLARDAQWNSPTTRSPNQPLWRRTSLPTKTSLPPELKQIYDPPQVLFVCGNVELSVQPGIALVRTPSHALRVWRGRTIGLRSRSSRFSHFQRAGLRRRDRRASWCVLGQRQDRRKQKFQGPKYFNQERRQPGSDLGNTFGKNRRRKYDLRSGPKAPMNRRQAKPHLYFRKRNCRRTKKR
jgi:hypothetical protein